MERKEGRERGREGGWSRKERREREGAWESGRKDGRRKTHRLCNPFTYPTNAKDLSQCRP